MNPRWILLCEFSNGNEIGSGRGIYLLIYQERGITLVALPQWHITAPPSTGGISKCVLTAEVTLSRPLDLGAVCLHLPWYLQMPGKRESYFLCLARGEN